MGNSPTNKKRRIGDGTKERDGHGASDSGDAPEAEQNGVEIIVYTDPWDVTGWNNEPDLRQLEETFGHNLTVRYDFPPARTIDAWESDTEMPTVDDPDLPESTKKSYRALKAAQQQGLERKYLRRLWIAALSEGRNIESKDTLIELAGEIGLNTDRLQKDMTDTEFEDPEPIENIPKMEVLIDDIPHSWNGNIEFGRVFGRIVGEGIQTQPAKKTTQQFVAEYEPVTTIEVAKVLELDRNDTIEELQQQEKITSHDFGIGTYWLTV